MATPALLPVYPSQPPPPPLPPLSSPENAPDQHRSRRAAAIRGLESCTTMAELRQHHSQLVRLGLSYDNDASGRILKFCALHPSGDLAYALRLFDRLPSPDPFIYNTLIRAHPQSPHHHHHRPLLLYSRMLGRSMLPNRFTFPPLIKSISADGQALDRHCGQVHAHVFKLGFHADQFSQNSLIHMYVNCSRLEDARRVFDQMALRDVVSWTTLMSGYTEFGLVDDARELFDEMPERNSVSWNAMISAYWQSGRFQEAFQLFDRMRSEGMVLEKFVAASMLSACTRLGALERGRWIHRYIENNGIDMDSKLATTIIDMYCKCGCLEKAYEVFNGLACKGLASWNCMIGGLAMHGQGEAAIELFGEMETERVVPDGITLLNVLSACAHVGLVEQGKHYFEYMIDAYGIQPKMEHFGCMVDLFGRVGRVWEAKKVIDEMPMEPDAGVLGALLGACKIHGEIELGEQIGRRVIELEPHNSGRYVLLANLYASVARWDDAANVRRLMNDRGVNKEPGCSVIEMDGVISEFIAGGRCHPRAREIYAMVDEMLKRVRLEGYVPDKGGVLHDIDEEEKENPLFYHSEKLAIAFGLLNTRPGEKIRISKNLRVCKDCHEASKLISKAYGCEIVVRDRNRFHHFKVGECSCKDFW